MSILKKIYDNSRSDSWASNLRKQRNILLESLINSISTSTSLKILDVGGRPKYWEHMLLNNKSLNNLELTFINIEKVNHPSFNCFAGDARNMPQFKDREFDLVFSNSVIEHVGSYESQFKMANEIKRVGTRYFVQTPNFYFPIEPHFLFPFFQFLTTDIKVWLLTHFSMGWYGKFSSQQEAKNLATQIQLLNKNKLLDLFPEATLYQEKIFGLTKSFIVYNGW